MGSAIAKFIAEFFGTMILVWLGDGVVANVLLPNSKGSVLSKASQWIVITTGWGLAVAMAVYITGWISGAHINPAVTIGLAAIGAFDWSLVPGYVIAQMAGGIVGAVLVYLTYLGHFKAAEEAVEKEGYDPVNIKAVFCTVPQYRDLPKNFLTELLATAMLLIGVVGITHPNNNIGALGPLAIGFLVWSIGLSLGGPTGYAINPARDLGPRIAYAILPIKHKVDVDWTYGILVPVIGTIIGGVIGAWIANFVVTLP
jgi:glycerol uptake facilitator protein